MPESASTSPGGLVGRLTVKFWVAVMNRNLCRGVAKLVKASDFDSDMRGFESFLPCQIFF